LQNFKENLIALKTLGKHTLFLSYFIKVFFAAEAAADSGQDAEGDLAWI
jgi:hypothetical protein